MANRALVVIAHLSGPLVDHGDPIHLDGLLGIAWAMRHPTHAHPTRTSDLSQFQEPHLPLAIVQHEGTMVRLGSAAAFVGQAPARVWQTSRRDAGDWDRLAGPVDVQAGPRKDRLIRTQAHLACALTWLGWGNLREIRKSLRLLWGREATPHGAVGSVRRAGVGQIVRWSAEAGEHGPTDVLLSGDSIFQRHVPASWIETAERLRRGAHRLPYWHPDRQGPVSMVGSRGRLSLGARQAIMEQVSC